MAEPSTTSATTPGAAPGTTTGTTPVIDRRPIPSGTVPRRAQAWLLAAIALVMLSIIFIAGRPEPPSKSPTAVGPAAQPMSPDRVREYQDRLRLLETQLAQEPPPTPTPSAPQPGQPTFYANDEPTRQPEDPLETDRRRRDYESLFASNVVLSRRPEAQQPDGGGALAALASSPVSQRPVDGTSPSIDDIAEAVVRATTRATPQAGSFASSNVATRPPLAVSSPAVETPPAQPRLPDRRATTEPISATGPMHRIPEGTLIDTVLTNRLDGSAIAPVNCLVTNPVYSHNRQHILIPAGARILGDTKPVQGFGDTRLAVAFHRILMPDGSSVSLDDFIGLNQIGEGGLRDRLNQHYWSTFGAAGAVGLITGLAQSLSTLGFGRGDRDRTVVIAGSAGDATAEATLQVMNRFLNRMPTITIREGHRVKVYVTSDLELPAYGEPVRLNAF